MRFALLLLLCVIGTLIVAASAQQFSSLDRVATRELRQVLRLDTRQGSNGLASTTAVASADVIVFLKHKTNFAQIDADVRDKVMRVLGSSDEEVTAQTISDLKASTIVHEARSLASLSQRPLQQFLSSSNVQFQSLWIDNAIVIPKASAPLLNELAKRFGSAIERIEHDGVFHVKPLGTESVNANDVTIQSNIHQVEAPKLWDLGFKGQGSVVAIVDTGIDGMKHEALVEKYRGNLDGGKTYQHDYNWFDGVVTSRSPTCGANTQEPCDSGEHGSHCTGSILGSTKDKFIGVAPEAKFIGCKALDGGSGQWSWALTCFQFMLAPTDLQGNNPSTEKRPHVVSNSFGGPYQGARVLYDATKALREAGIFMAVANGNSGPSCATVGYPGGFDTVFGVGAVDSTGKIAYFSSRGPNVNNGTKPEISAPGVDIVSSVPGNRYSKMSGTSMATPHVAGSVALLWSAVPKLVRDVAATERILQQSALHVSTNDCKSKDSLINNVYGAGNIRNFEAYKLAQQLLAERK